MKRTAALAAILAAVAVAIPARADPILVITNYLPGYVAVTSDWSTVENSGLAAGTAYVCIPLASLTNTTPAQMLTAANCVATGAASDIRALLFAVNDTAYTAYAAMASTNQPANATLTRVSTSSSTTSYQTTHTLKTKLTLSTAVLTPE